MRPTHLRPIAPDLHRASLRRTLLPFGKRFFWAFLFSMGVIAAGTAGYVALEKWKSFDAFYMAVVTASSVGYAEVHPLSHAGRVFTVALLALSVVGLGIWWALITAFIVEMDFAGVFRRRRNMKRIESLSDHHIVCGAGRVGRVLVEELATEGVPFVVIEVDPDRAATLRDTGEGVPVIEADATREGTLETAGVVRAKGLAACLSSDADNLLLCLTARGMRPDMEIVARANEEESLEKLRRAGANHVISPPVTGAKRMAASLVRPSIVSFLDAATLGSDIALRLEETTIPKGASIVGRSLSEARIPQRTGLVVLALRRGFSEDAPSYNPGPETRLEAGDTMIVLGREEQIASLREYVGSASDE